MKIIVMGTTTCLINDQEFRMDFLKTSVQGGEFVKGTVFTTPIKPFEYTFYFDKLRQPQIEHTIIPADWLVSIMQAVDSYSPPDAESTFLP
jgi:hypothetical protein